MKRQVVYQKFDTKGGERRNSRRSFMFKLFAFAFAVSLGFFGAKNMLTTHAADLSQFKAGNIMSDAVMRNYTSMTEAEIQSFLKSKNACNKVATAGWYVNEGNQNGVKYNYRYDYNGTTYLYHVENGRHICMADESFNGESAAHIIYDVARQYKVNPQVLIALLQKEQGLITDTWPNVNFQYRSATGFGCPDTAPCDSEYYGLRNQIENAAWLFDKVLSGGWTNYPVGWNWVRYSPDASCGGSNVYIENLATSSLYRYTPYQPNAGALAAYTGTAHCGAYGNRNFFIYFSDWFGSTQKVQYTFPQNYYNKNSGTTGLLTGETKCLDGNGNAADLGVNGDYYCSQDFERGTLFWNTNVKNSVRTESNEFFLPTAKANAYKNLDINQRKDKIYQEWIKNLDTVGNVKTVSAFEKDGNFRVLQAEKGVVFGNDTVGYFAYKQKAFEAYKGLYSTLGAPTVGHEENGSTKIEWYTFKNGLIVGNDNNGWFISMGGSRNAWARQGYENGSLGFPKGNIVYDEVMKTTYQEYAGGVLIANDAKNFSIMKKKAFEAWRNLKNNLGKMTAGHAENGSTKIEWYTFEKGMVVGNDSKGWFESRGKIRDVWARQGYESGALGFPAGNITESNGVYSQKYTGGVVSGNDQKGYGVENSGVAKAYEKNKSLLGNLVSGPAKTASTGMEWYTYEKGLIVGNNNKGWFISIGKSREVWARKGFEWGLGFPTSDLQKNTSTGMEWQNYENGVVVGNDQKGWFESRGRIREIWAASGYEWGRYGFPTSDINGSCQRYEGGTICQ